MSKYEQENGKHTGSNLICIPIQSKRRINKRQVLTLSNVDGNPGDDSEETSYSFFLPQNLNDIINTTDIQGDSDSKGSSETSKSNDAIFTELDNNQQEKRKTEKEPEPIPFESSTTDSPKPETTVSKTQTNETTPQPQTTPTPASANRKTTTKAKYVAKYADMIGTRKYIPCAVCDVEQHTQQLMVPAATTCPHSWIIQYQGYLMNYHHGTQAANVVCVNDQALGISPSSDAGIRKIVSKYLSHIVIDCKTFPCPPLNHSELLKCVVCTK